MAIAKTITVADLSKTGNIIIMQLPGGKLRFNQEYNFLNASNQVIEGIGAKNVSVEVLFASLPASIQQGLLAIQDYLYHTALTAEGMNE